MRARRRFTLVVDDGTERAICTFGSLDSALLALAELSERDRRFAWVREYRDGTTITHVADGRRVRT